jgi:hypothetical protein
MLKFTDFDRFCAVLNFDAEWRYVAVKKRVQEIMALQEFLWVVCNGRSAIGCQPSAYERLQIR